MGTCACAALEVVTKGHYGAALLVLGGLAVQLSALHAWTDLGSPAVAGGIVLNLIGSLTAARSPQVGRDHRRRTRWSDGRAVGR